MAPDEQDTEVVATDQMISLCHYAQIVSERVLDRIIPLPVYLYSSEGFTRSLRRL
jgi:hypothetical protein